MLFDCARLMFCNHEVHDYMVYNNAKKNVRISYISKEKNSEMGKAKVAFHLFKNNKKVARMERIRTRTIICSSLHYIHKYFVVRSLSESGTLVCSWLPGDFHRFQMVEDRLF